MWNVFLEGFLSVQAYGLEILELADFPHVTSLLVVARQERSTTYTRLSPGLGRNTSPQ